MCQMFIFDVMCNSFCNCTSCHNATDRFLNNFNYVVESYWLKTEKQLFG